MLLAVVALLYIFSTTAGSSLEHHNHASSPRRRKRYIHERVEHVEDPTLDGSDVIASTQQRQQKAGKIRKSSGILVERTGAIGEGASHDLQSYLLNRDKGVKCLSILPSPEDAENSVAGHLSGDAWPNHDIKCSASYWNYESLSRVALWLNHNADKGPGEVYRNAMASNSPLARCCRHEDVTESALLAVWGAQLVKPTLVFPKRHSSYNARILIEPMCPSSDAMLIQNPMMLAFHSTRWFNACPGNIFVQYSKRATRSDRKMRSYPFSYVNPFLRQFDWVLGPVGPSDANWRNLGAVKGMAHSMYASLYAQRTVPLVIYCTNGKPFVDILRRILSLFHRRGHKVVVYIGGLDGTPNEEYMVQIASFPSVAALFAENLDVPLSHRPKGNKLLNAPLGLCMREAVTFAGQLVEAISNAPHFDDRYPDVVFGCYGATHGGREVSQREFKQRGLFSWCSDRPPNAENGFQVLSGKAKNVHNMTFEMPVRCGEGHGNESFEAARARAFWTNASKFKFAFSPFGNGCVSDRSRVLLLSPHASLLNLPRLLHAFTSPLSSFFSKIACDFSEQP